MSDDHTKKTVNKECIIGRRGRTHIDSCTKTGWGTAYNQNTKKPFKNQVHHILCITNLKAVNRSVGDAKQDELNTDCLYITPWNINREENVIALITMAEIIKKKGSMLTNDFIFPTHTRDHRKYFLEVTDWLVENVWQQIKKVSDNGECKKVNSESIIDLLKSGEDNFLDELEDRGSRNGGLKESWDMVIKKSPEDWKDKWFLAFSLAENPAARIPPKTKKK